MSKGFLESLIESTMFYTAVQASKDGRGKSDSYKAAGMVFGAKGDLSYTDIAELGAVLGAEGAFDDD